MSDVPITDAQLRQRLDDDARMSSYPPSLAASLALLMTRLPDIKKSERADVEMKSGGTYSYTYADLANISRALLPVLGELGLSFTAKPMSGTDGKLVLAYKLLHVSGESEAGEYPISGGGSPQAIGSAITYARRYTLCAITGLAPEDDDDAATAEAETGGTAQRARKQPAPTAGRGARATRKPAEVEEGPGTARRARPQSGSQPPLPGEEDKPYDPAEHGPLVGPSTGAQHQRMAIMFAEIGLGKEEREDRLAIASSIVDREVTSGKDLTKQEASDLMEILATAKAEKDAGRDPITYLWSRSLVNPKDEADAAASERAVNDEPIGGPE